MESKEERLLRAIFGNEPQAKALKFSLNIQFQPRKSNSAYRQINNVQVLFRI